CEQYFKQRVKSQGRKCPCKTLKSRAFRVSVRWDALVRKPLALERGGFTLNFLKVGQILGEWKFQN
uniref:hypothetical protein n=1 Tax=Helicobacter pylori TaxID=210 RepID=UPI000EABA0C0